MLSPFIVLISVRHQYEFHFFKFFRYFIKQCVHKGKKADLSILKGK